MDGAEYYKINLRFNDIEKPFSLTVRRNTDEEKIFREATSMINSYYDEYKKRIVGLDKTSYFAMVALLMARLYIETTNSKKELEDALAELEKEIVAYLENNQ